MVLSRTRSADAIHRFSSSCWCSAQCGWPLVFSTSIKRWVSFSIFVSLSFACLPPASPNQFDSVRLSSIQFESSKRTRHCVELNSMRTLFIQPTHLKLKIFFINILSPSTPLICLSFTGFADTHIGNLRLFWLLRICFSSQTNSSCHHRLSLCLPSSKTVLTFRLVRENC